MGGFDKMVRSIDSSPQLYNGFALGNDYARRSLRATIALADRTGVSIADANRRIRNYQKQNNMKTTLEAGEYLASLYDPNSEATNDAKMTEQAQSAEGAESSDSSSSSGEENTDGTTTKRSGGKAALKVKKKSSSGSNIASANNVTSGINI